MGYATIFRDWWLSQSSVAKESRVAVDAECQTETDAEFLRHVYSGFVAWKEALSTKAIVDFMRLGIPGMLQVMFEWYVFLDLHRGVSSHNSQYWNYIC